MKFKKGAERWESIGGLPPSLLLPAGLPLLSHPALGHLDEALTFSLGCHWGLPQAWAARPTAPWGCPCKQEISKGLSSHSLEIANTATAVPASSWKEPGWAPLRTSAEVTGAHHCSSRPFVAGSSGKCKRGQLTWKIFLPPFSVHLGRQCSGKARPRSAQTSAQAL